MVVLQKLSYHHHWRVFVGSAPVHYLPPFTRAWRWLLLLGPGAKGCFTAWHWKIGSIVLMMIGCHTFNDLMRVVLVFFSSHQVNVLSPAPAGWHTGTRDQQQVVVHEVVAKKEVICKTVVCPKDVPLSLVDMVENPTRTVWILQTSFSGMNTVCMQMCRRDHDSILIEKSPELMHSTLQAIQKHATQIPATSLHHRPLNLPAAKTASMAWLWICSVMTWNGAWLEYLRCFLQIGPSGMGPMLCQWLVYLIFSTAASVFVLPFGSSMWFALPGGGVPTWEVLLKTYNAAVELWYNKLLNCTQWLSHPWQSLVQTCWNFLAGGC